MRYHFLDNMRGLTFISMVLFHLCWDMAYIFDMDMPWMGSTVAYVWQQSILYAFVLLSGFCWGLGHRRLKRGLIVFGAGLLVSIVTAVAMPDEIVAFGVLTFLGCAMLVLIPLEKLLKKVPALPILVVCLVLFFVTREIPYGYFGFGDIHIAPVPKVLYADLLTTFFGFQMKGFISSDYVPFLPWIFLFIAGYCIFRLIPRKKEGEKELLKLPQQKAWPVADFLGRHSLIVYLVHQPLIYGILYACFALAGLISQA